MPKFVCEQCGKCCSKIRGKLSKDEEDFLRENAFGKMPLFQLIPIEETSFPLWDWEAKRFKEWEKEVGINAKIRPSRAVYDLDGNKTIVVTYHMDSDSCPFLTEKKCLIYDKPRAFVCRLFPFQRTPFLDIDEKPEPGELLGSCPVVMRDLDKIPKDKDEMIKWFSEYFEDGSFLNAVQNDITIAWVNKTIVELCKSKVIRPTMNYPYDKLLKRAENSEKVDLMDFLVEKNIKTREEIDELVKRFDDNTDAKEKLG
jgi:Fe-S-cluster containining protein|tara:strand:- start:477 stop:1244 length:768 start_codon:yes stop_codon:yes gene_type:complete